MPAIGESAQWDRVLGASIAFRGAVRLEVYYSVAAAPPAGRLPLQIDKYARCTGRDPAHPAPPRWAWKGATKPPLWIWSAALPACPCESHPWIAPATD